MTLVLPEVVGCAHSSREKIQYHNRMNRTMVRTGHGISYTLLPRQELH